MDEESDDGEFDEDEEDETLDVRDDDEDNAPGSSFTNVLANLKITASDTSAKDYGRGHYKSLEFATVSASIAMT